MTSQPRTVLFTTIGLNRGTGTEIYTRDLATALLRLGWRPVVYTLQTGRLAEELRQRTIPVIEDLEMLAVPPDVIHGHHSLETLTALVRFPSVPALFVVHGGSAWNSIPPVLDRIRAYVAVDENCRDRMVCEYGVPASRSRILPNAVDLRRFQPRPPLPPRPVRALVFSNGAREDTIVRPIRQACAARGIEVDVAGAGEGFAEAPETLLPRYDLVFAKARCALEALAIGNAVVLCDYCGLGPMVTSAALADLRRLNLGIRTLPRDVTAEAVGREIDRYDPADAAAVQAMIRRTADVDVLAQELGEIYEEIGREPVAAAGAADAAAIARYLRLFSTRLYAEAPRNDSLGRRVLERLRRSRVATPVLHRLHRWLHADA